jgi:arylsulfatase A-like enzyme
VTPQQESSPGLPRYLTLGAIQGLAAWSAYAVIEFLASSVLFRLGRPYARFTTWHWALTGQLILAFMAAGLVSGALSGLVVFFVRNGGRLSGSATAWTMEHAAALTLTLAVALHMALTPAAPSGSWKLLMVPLALSAILLLAIRSEAWSIRFGLLTSPWIVAGLLLGCGQIFALEDQGVAGQLGVSLRLWYFLLSGVLALAAAAAIWVGRRWRRSWNPSRIFAPNWAAPGLAAVLMVTSFALGMEPSSPAAPNATIAGSSPRPNVILIVMDTVRADHLSLFGYHRDTTPNLKNLAADAALYPEALSAADITLTSHASIFTGLYPSWHGAYCQPPEASFGRAIGPVPTIAEVLARNGYHTLGVAANLYLRADFGLQRGFADFRIPRPVPVLAGDESWYMLRNAMRHAINLLADTSQFDRLYSRADAVNAEFFTLVRQPTLAQAPFFAFFNYMDAHFPYIPPHPFDRLFPGKDASATEADLDAIQTSVSQKGTPLPPVYTSHAVSQYDGGIAYIDSQIGRLVDWLKRQNLYDNTLLIVTADHGESFGERRLFLHGNSLYANLLHVPLLVKYPHNAHAGVVGTPVSLIDIFPTIMKITGVEPPKGLQGMDLLDPAAAAPRNLFSESFPCPVPHVPECPGGCMMRSVVSWPDKFIWSGNGRLQTYQLDQDPNESRNLFGSLNKTAQGLSAELRAWIKTMPPQPKQYRNMSPADIARFKALGYIQ